MRIITLAAIAALIGFSVQAQETPNVTEQFPVGGVNNEPQEVVKETFEDWEIRCTGEGANCFMYQLMLNDKGTPVAEFSIVKLPMGSEAVAGATIVAPLGTLLTRGLVFVVDENEATQYPFTWCVRPGCFARFGLTDLIVNSMESGNAVKIAIFSIADAQKPVEVTASLKGFSAAFAALQHQGQ